jgi:hypothetical protein
VRCGATAARLLEEIPDVRLVVLLDREANPDVKRRPWLDSGIERDMLGPDLARVLDRALRGKLRAVSVSADAVEDPLSGPIQEVAYSPTFSC